MNRNSYSSCLVRNSTSDSLPNPPGSICRKLKALCVIKFINSLNKTEITLLNEVKKLHTSADVPFCNTYYKAKIGLSKSLLGLLIILRNSDSKFNFFLRCKKRHTAYFLKIHLYRIIHCGIIINSNSFSCICFLRQINFKADSVKCLCRKIINNANVCRINLLIELFKLGNIKVKVNNKCINILS